MEKYKENVVVSKMHIGDLLTIVVEQLVNIELVLLERYVLYVIGGV